MSRDRACTERGRAVFSVYMGHAWPRPGWERQGIDQGQFIILKGSLVFLNKPERPDPGPRLRLTLVLP